MQLARQLRALNRRAQEHLETLSALLAEVFSSLTIVKGFGREAYEQERFQRRNATYYAIAMRAAQADEIGSPLMECLGAVGVAAVVWYGGQQVIAGVTTPGVLFLSDSHFHALRTDAQAQSGEQYHPECAGSGGADICGPGYTRRVGR